jgi:hypothetical protein
MVSCDLLLAIIGLNKSMVVRLIYYNIYKNLILIIEK